MVLAELVIEQGGEFKIVLEKCGEVVNAWCDIVVEEVVVIVVVVVVVVEVAVVLSMSGATMFEVLPTV